MMVHAVIRLIKSYHKEAVECQHLILWPVSQGRVHCHAEKLKPNQRGLIADVSQIRCDMWNFSAE
jgi:hypothetical protein